MDGWTDGWMDGWMDRWMDGWMDEWMDERVHLKKSIVIVIPPYRLYACLLFSQYKVQSLLSSPRVAVLFDAFSRILA